MASSQPPPGAPRPPGPGPGSAGPDVAVLAAGLGTALHAAGLPVGPDRCERLARAVTVMAVSSVAELHACALATLVSDPSQVNTFEQVFAALFGVAPPPLRGMPTAPPRAAFGTDEDGGPPPTRRQQGPEGWQSGLQIADTGSAPADGEEPESGAPGVHRVASAAEQLRGRDFTELSPAELRQLVALMREMALSVPPRRTR